MTSSGDPEIERINAELDCLSLKGQQLRIRRQILSKYQEFRKNREESGKSEEGALNQHELDSIDDSLKQLSDRKAALQKRKENILDVKQHKKEDNRTDSARAAPAAFPVPEIFFIVEPPPSFPAPSVILDLEKLSTHPGNTQCPQCQQFITTEVVSSVSSLTWFMCFTIAMMGCVAGCCLIPFCTKTFKTTSHRCPRCRTLLQNVKTL